MDKMMMNEMWTHLPIDRASTPIEKRSFQPQPRTSTPKLSKISYSIQQRLIKKKKKKKKQLNHIDYHLLFYGNIKKKTHSAIQIWFL
ncbi:unnamed protein product [Adineta steineri]|uniref:Uncharacterized protein n=1 Tax=Adineta steineri TaxID=433720 RepID=A0A815HW44_9BILA|nr:unnamed protein product [Adineta steineri]CAF1355845.1 unnamed protein product [Adineta steineri]CAF3487875.1 unnamed protein product [Adineta steineri]CAF3798232.1 unnamed protein product [Adineta steineri]